MQINFTLTDEQVAQVSVQLQQVLKENIRVAVQELSEAQSYPGLLNKKEAKELLRIKSDSKMDELLNRPDFPVVRSTENGFPYFLYDELIAWMKKQSTWAKRDKPFKNAI
jgi:hypothetical protein